MDSRLVKLVPAGGYFLLSVAERRLLEFALDLFGEQLSQFLLSGTGEVAEARVWHFTVTFADERGAVRSREIRVEPDDIPDDPQILPCLRDPLVILTLLRLLIEDPVRSSSSLSYQQEQVLNLLRWEDTAETRSAIDRAVKRYTRLSYSWGLGGEELAERRLSFYDAEGRFVSGYGHYDAEEGGEYKRVANTVDFPSVFVEGLTRRAIFGVDWNRVSEITREVLG